MSNILNEPQNDAFEDNFFEELARYNRFTIRDIERENLKVHLKLGGEYGDECFEYALMLVKECKDIKGDGYNYKWRI